MKGVLKAAKRYRPKRLAVCEEKSGKYRPMLVSERRSWIALRMSVAFSSNSAVKSAFESTVLKVKAGEEVDDKLPVHLEIQ